MSTYRANIKRQKPGEYSTIGSTITVEAEN